MRSREKVSTFRERLVELCNESPYSDTELATKLKVSKQTLSAWKAGTRSPKENTIIAIAQYFGVNVEWLMGFDVLKKPSIIDVFMVVNAHEHKEDGGAIPVHTARYIPLLGSIACGTPITAEENVEDYVNIPSNLNCQFALRCKGDSMSPRVIDGDLVYIRQQPDVEDGQIAAVIIDGEATLKHVYHIPGGIQLVSDNPAYRPLIYTDQNSDDLRIVGLAIAYQRMLI